MSEACTIIIGAPQHLDSLKQRADSSGEVLTYGDDDALAALSAITSKRPQVVTLERLFAATSRGAALINRIKSDPSLASAEIRVMSHDGSYSRVSPRRAPVNSVAAKDETPSPIQPAVVQAEATTAATPVPLDYRGTRRATRFRLVEGTEAQLDGGLAKVVDLSVCGAQVISQQALKPQQRIRIVLADDLGMVKLNGSVAWASFEIPKGTTRYRAGVEFKDAETKAVEAFCMRHKT